MENYIECLQLKLKQPDEMASVISFDRINKNILTYLLEKMIPYVSGDSINSVTIISENAKIILNDEIIYLNLLKKSPELQYAFKKFMVLKGFTWISKYYLYLSLVQLKVPLDYYVGSTGDYGINLSSNHIIFSGKELVMIHGSFDYLNVPGVDFEKVQKVIVKVLDAVGYIGVIISKSKQFEPFKLKIINSHDRKLYYEVELNEYQLRVLIIGALYSNVSVNRNLQ